MWIRYEIVSTILGVVDIFSKGNRHEDNAYSPKHEYTHALHSRTVPNMILQVISKSARFSVKIEEKILKKFHQRFDEIFDVPTAIFVTKHE